MIYTRNSVCAPIRAEEGITGILCPPNSSTSFSELPKEQQIGGYPTYAQLAASTIDAATLDSEGRCVIIEFPAFVLLGVYSPANRDETRDEFRLGFLDLLDARIRNLIAIGKHVFLTGDLNISREEIDTANPESSMRKNGMTAEEYASTPARRLFNQLLEGGKVFGDRDEGREKPVLWDICRAFHPDRKGMFTCWEQKTNARPANCGARIDYVLCNLAMKDWFSDSNIQEGLMVFRVLPDCLLVELIWLQGSDHCPVYATMKDKICIGGDEIDVHDVMNPPGMFINAKRQREHSRKDLLPLSGKLIPEFDRRRNIGDMFVRKPSLPKSQSSVVSQMGLDDTPHAGTEPDAFQNEPIPTASATTPQASESATISSLLSSSTSQKRSMVDVSANNQPKRAKSGSTAKTPPTTTKGQQSLKGFFKSKSVSTLGAVGNKQGSESTPLSSENIPSCSLLPAVELVERSPTGGPGPQAGAAKSSLDSPPRTIPNNSQMDRCNSAEASPLTNGAYARGYKDLVHDPIESKESWTKLFTKPAAPRCEGHNEPCISLLTKKSGMNCGRSFWMCPRPIGPTGAKERNTQWRCQTFIWCSDWNPGSA